MFPDAASSDRLLGDLANLGNKLGTCVGEDDKAHVQSFAALCRPRNAFLLFQEAGQSKNDSSARP